MAATITPSHPIRRFIKRQAVEDITGLSCSEIYRRIAAGTFPAQVTLGPKSVVWIEARCWPGVMSVSPRAVGRWPEMKKSQPLSQQASPSQDQHITASASPDVLLVDMPTKIARILPTFWCPAIR